MIEPGSDSCKVNALPVIAAPVSIPNIQSALFVAGAQTRRTGTALPDTVYSCGQDFHAAGGRTGQALGMTSSSALQNDSESGVAVFNKACLDLS